MGGLLRWGVVGPVTVSSRHRFPTPLLASAIALAVALTGCSGGDDDATTTTIEATTTTIRPSVETDGRLVIGVMVPSSDPPISEPMQAAVDTAVARINAAGGVLDGPVEVVVAEEGETAASVADAVQTLIDADVDAIIGPASSLVALGSLDEIASAGKLACSPTASAMALDDFPDNGLFFRTVPSDSLQARAIAQAADQTGAQRATVVYVDDAYGRGLADAVSDALQPGAISVVDAIPFRATDDLGDQVTRLIESDAQVAIVLANADDGTLFLSELDTADTAAITHVFVNDAMRNPPTPQRIADLDPTFRGKIVGLAPQAESPDPAVPFDPPGPFAANAYDCVNLIALAAIVAGSDAPRAIADQMSLVSSSGSPCRTFEGCVAETEKGLQINYDGPSGLTEIQARQGDPARAIFDRFTYDETGTDVLLGTVTAS